MEAFLAGGGATGELLRHFDWAATPLGRPAEWPSPLKTLVGVMLASSQPMFVAWGPARTLVYNESYAAILARKHPAAIGRDMLEVWADIRDDVGPLVEQVFRGESVHREAMPLTMQRRGYVEDTFFSFFYTPVRDDEGAVLGLYCACTETTSEVMAQRRVQDSEARLRGVLDNMDEGFALLDGDFRMQEMNDAGVRMVDIPREQMIGRSHWDVFPGTEDTELGRMYKRCMADKVPRRIEFLYPWPGRAAAWFEVRATPSGRGLALFYRDITSQRQLAEQAALSAERVQLALDAGAILGTWVWDVSADTFLADARFARSFGLDERQCRTGLPLEAVMASIHPDDRPRVGEAVAEVLARGGAYRCEYRVRQFDGVFRWVEANGHVQRLADGSQRFPGVLLDIESRRQMAAERDRATAMLRAFLEAVPGVVYFKDRDGRMLLANRGTAELIGKPPEEFLGKTDRDYLVDRAQAEAVMATDRRIMDSGRAEQIEEEVRLADGTPALWLSTKAPMRDAQGRVVGLVGSSVDISERKRNEEALRESDQRKSEFLAVLSHELRNPLAPIRNGLHVLERAPAGSPHAARAMEIIRRQSEHLTRLVDDLLDMTRISRGKIDLQREHLDLNVIVRRAADDLAPMLADGGARLETDLAGALWLDADATRVGQVVGNLLHNAIKFTPPGGLIRLSTRAADGAAVLTVEDSGIGMDPGTVDAMFAPFAQGEQGVARSKGGLGLGLSVVRGLVELHGGTVGARSEGAGHGAKFTVSLPLAREQAPVVATSAAAEHPTGAARRVLIVEDNADAARSLVELLHLEGHEARVAGDGHAALKLAREQPPDLVLCDIGLPDMDGYALARALRADPALHATRLIALSGYAQPADRRRSADAGFDGHLAKPPDIGKLLQLIAAAGDDQTFAMTTERMFKYASSASGPPSLP